MNYDGSAKAFDATLTLNADLPCSAALGVLLIRTDALVPGTFRLSLGGETNAFRVWASNPAGGTPLPVRDAETGEYTYADTTGDGVNNTSGLTLKFTRATGLFSGAFKAWYDYESATDLTTDTSTRTHTSKSVTFQGALTPVRESGDAEGRGFFLWADKGSYENAAGKTVTYGFNGSYDFLLLGL